MAEDVILNFSPPRPRPVSTANIKNRILRTEADSFGFQYLLDNFETEDQYQLHN